MTIQHVNAISNEDGCHPSHSLHSPGRLHSQRCRESVALVAVRVFWALFHRGAAAGPG